MLIDRRFIVLAETKPSLHVPRGAVGGGRGAQQGLGNLLRMANDAEEGGELRRTRPYFIQALHAASGVYSDIGYL